jgi:opine dehydrogenase
MVDKVTVFGAGLDAQTMVADLSFAGFNVNMLTLPGQHEILEKIIKENGGIYLEGKHTISGRNGYAKPNMITTNAKKAIKNSDVIIFTHPTSNYEERMEYISAYVENDQIINFNTYGYWPSLRVLKYLKSNKNNNYMLTESPAPVYWPAGKTGHVKPLFIRNQIPLATFPSSKKEETLDVMKNIFPSFELAKNILQTNLENINLMVHPSIALLNIGLFDRSNEKGKKIEFYKTGNTLHTGLLMELLDKERRKICEAYEVRALPVDDFVKQLYDSEGKNIYEVILNCEAYQNWGSIPADSWIGMCKDDIPLSFVPAAQLADLAEVSIPLTKSIIHLTSGLLGINFWETGLTLQKMGLANLNVKEIQEYVKECK